MLGEDKFVPGFEAQIVGLRPGEKEFSLKVPTIIIKNPLPARILILK